MSTFSASFLSIYAPGKFMHWLSALLSSLLFALAAAPAAGQPAPVQRAFEDGNRRYAEGDYAAALRRYEQALESGWASGALYYNVAAAHYRLGRAGQAVRYYEKARRLLPASERLQHNLSVVRSQIEAPPPAPRSFRATAWERLTALMPPVGYLAVGLFVFLGALAWWVRTNGEGGRRFRPGPLSAALLAAGLLVAGLGLVLSAGPAERRAVAVRGPLTLRSAPSASADSTAALPEGTVVNRTERRGGWARVRSSRGDEGWADAGALGGI